MNKTMWTKGGDGETIGIEIERWGLGCADIGRPISLVREKPPNNRKTGRLFSTAQQSTVTEHEPYHTLHSPPEKQPSSPENPLFPLINQSITFSQHPNSLTSMHTQPPPTIASSKARGTSAAPRRSSRSRKATTRFAEGWYGEKLPRLSAALGVGQSRANTLGEGGGAAPSSEDDDRLQSSGFEAEDEVQNLDVTMIEEAEEEVVVVSKPRRSGRERKATKRFEEGWFAGRLPRLGMALGVDVSA